MKTLSGSEASEVARRISCTVQCSGRAFVGIAMHAATKDLSAQNRLYISSPGAIIYRRRCCTRFLYARTVAIQEAMLCELNMVLYCSVSKYELVYKSIWFGELRRLLLCCYLMLINLPIPNRMRISLWFVSRERSVSSSRTTTSNLPLSLQLSHRSRHCMKRLRKPCLQR